MLVYIVTYNVSILFDLCEGIKHIDKECVMRV